MYFTGQINNYVLFLSAPQEEVFISSASDQNSGSGRHPTSSRDYQGGAAPVDDEDTNDDLEEASGMQPWEEDAFSKFPQDDWDNLDYNRPSFSFEDSFRRSNIDDDDSSFSKSSEIDSDWNDYYMELSNIKDDKKLQKFLTLKHQQDQEYYGYVKDKFRKNYVVSDSATHNNKKKNKNYAPFYKTVFDDDEDNENSRVRDNQNKDVITPKRCKKCKKICIFGEKVSQL